MDRGGAGHAALGYAHWCTFQVHHEQERFDRTTLAFGSLICLPREERRTPPMRFALPELPITDPVLYFALVTAVFFVIPLLFERLGVPGLIGLIIVGAAIGPNGAGLLERDQVMLLLGTVGLLYLMFLVGLELDLDQFRRQRHHSIL